MTDMTDLRHCFWRTCCLLGVCVCLQELKLSPTQSFHGIRAWYRLRPASTRSKGGGTAARGHHLFPFRFHYYTRVRALREAPANDIGSRSCLCQDKAIGVVYYFLDGILGLKLRFGIISTSVFELAGACVLFEQDVSRHQSNC